MATTGIRAPQKPASARQRPLRGCSHGKETLTYAYAIHHAPQGILCFDFFAQQWGECWIITDPGDNSSEPRKVCAGQHPAAWLAGKFNETEVLVERSRFGRLGVDDEGSHREGFAGGRNALARIGQQDRTESLSLKLPGHGQTAE